MPTRNPSLLKTVIHEQVVEVCRASDGASVVTIPIETVPTPMVVKNALRGIAAALRDSWLKAETEQECIVAARTRASAILGGTWNPVRPAAAEAEPTDLEHALMQNRKKDLATIRYTWVPAYFATEEAAGRMKRDARGRLHGKADALDRLARHSELSPIISKLVADRARRSRGQDLIDLDTIAESSTTREAAE